MASMVFSAISTVVGLFLGLVGMFGVSEEKHPWIHNIRGARSLPGWLLIFYPEVGRWFLALTRQDFEVSARGGSPLTDIFNGLTTDTGHIWMAIAGGVWLGILMLLQPSRKRPIYVAPPVTAIPPGNQPPAHAALLNPVRQVPPPKQLTMHKPIWRPIYQRKIDYDRPVWISETEGQRSYGVEQDAEVRGLLARFSSTQYISDLTARLTFYDASKREMMTIHGCWLDTPQHNEINIRAGDIASLLIWFHAKDGGKDEYVVADDKRHHYTKPFEHISFDLCPVEAGWQVRLGLFLRGTVGPEYRFECFAGASGKIEIRDVESKETSE